MLPIRILDSLGLALVAGMLLVLTRTIEVSIRELNEYLPFVILLTAILFIVRWGLVAFRGMENPYFALLPAKIFIWLFFIGSVLIAARYELGIRPEIPHVVFVSLLFGVATLLSFRYTEERRKAHRQKFSFDIGSTDRTFTLISHGIGLLIVGAYVYRSIVAPEEFKRWGFADEPSFIVKSFAFLFVAWILLKIGFGTLFKMKDVLETKKVSRFFIGLTLTLLAGCVFINVLLRNDAEKMIQICFGLYILSVVLFFIVPTRGPTEEELLDSEDFELD